MKIPQPLTPSKVKSVKPNGKRIAIADGGARGLYLVVVPSGRRTWELRYTSPKSRKQTSVTLGVWPTMQIADARREAEEQRTLLEKGADPVAERRRARSENELTTEAVARAWDEARDDVDEHTRRTAMSRLERYVFPTLGPRPFGTLVQADLASVLDPIVKAGQGDTANRVCTVLSQIYRWSIARGDVEVDRAAQVKPNYPKVASGSYAAIVEPVAFGGLLRAIDGYSGYVVRQCLRLDALTFVRSGEIRGARWVELRLDGDDPQWVIPASRMKREENGDHVVPLSRQAVEILRETMQVSGRGELVFPGLRPGKPLSDATLNAALTTLGYTSDVHRVHGFRSSASTMLNEMAAADGFARWDGEAIEWQLAHRKADKVRGIYDRSTRLPQRRVMMQAWADRCDEMRARTL